MVCIDYITCRGGCKAQNAAWILWVYLAVVRQQYSFSEQNRPVIAASWANRTNLFFRPCLALKNRFGYVKSSCATSIAQEAGLVNVAAYWTLTIIFQLIVYQKNPMNASVFENSVRPVLKILFVLSPAT